MTTDHSDSNNDYVTTYVDVVRHGQPAGGEVFRGRTDHPLTDVGQWQFEQRLQRHSLNYQTIISSPLQRCHASAEQFSQLHGLPLHVVTDWQEIDFGDWEDQLISKVMQSDSQHAQQMWQDPLNFCAPGGEPVSELRQRITTAWQQLLQQHEGQSILLVTHGGVMRVLAQQLLNLAPEAMSQLSIPYAGLMRFRIDHQQGASDLSKTSSWVTLELLDGEPLTPAVASE